MKTGKARFVFSGGNREGENGMLRDIPGEKIRRQYFNIPIFFVLVVYMSLTLALLITSVAAEKPSLEDWWAFAEVLTAIAGLLLLPMAALSVLNRFCFGEIICVLNEKGLYYEDEAVRFIPWRELRSISYEPDIPWRSGYRWHCYGNWAEITVQSFKKKKQFTLYHVPYMLLGKIKKYAPDVHCGLTKFGVALVVAMALLPVGCALLAWLDCVVA